MAAHFSILAWSIPVDRGAWQAPVYKEAKSQTQLKHLSMHAHRKHFQLCGQYDLETIQICSCTMNAARDDR